MDITPRGRRVACGAAGRLTGAGCAGGLVLLPRHGDEVAQVAKFHVYT